MLNKYYEKIKQYMKENWLFLISLLAIIFLFTFELPYVIYVPGGAIDLEERISVEEGYDTEGSLSMAYVSMIRGKIPFLFLSYIIPNWDIIPTSDIKPENESLDEMIHSDQISLIEAQNNALYSAFSLAGKEIKVKSLTNHIVYLTDEADTDLKLFDQILTMNGEEVKNLDTVREIVEDLKIGERVEFTILRDEQEKVCYATVYETSEGAKVGIGVITTYEYETDPKVELTFEESESGPSGGLMTSLAIYNNLVEEDITKGKNIIGTGTIDQNGVVGSIGGVKYKLLGAVKNKADIFLVPKDNYDEAIQTKNEHNLDIRIISVETLKEAVEAISK